jgi:hypothetical protein
MNSNSTLISFAIERYNTDITEHDAPAWSRASHFGRATSGPASSAGDTLADGP